MSSVPDPSGHADDHGKLLALAELVGSVPSSCTSTFDGLGGGEKSMSMIQATLRAPVGCSTVFGCDLYYPDSVLYLRLQYITGLILPNRIRHGMSTQCHCIVSISVTR
jgi:predicted alpha/beta-hydrolase family hydrolase